MIIGSVVSESCDDKILGRTDRRTDDPTPFAFGDAGKNVAAVAQWVRAFAPEAEVWVF